MSRSEEGLIDFCARIYAADRSALESIGYFVSADGQSWVKAEVSTVPDTQNCYIQKPQKTLAQGSRYLKILLPGGEKTDAAHIQIGQIETKLQQAWSDTFDSGFEKIYERSGNSGINTWDGAAFGGDWAVVNRSDSQDITLTYEVEKGKYSGAHASIYLWMRINS